MVPEELLRGKLKLVDGRVSCVTCHDMFNPRNHRKFKLAISNKSNKLCQTCHPK